MALLVALLAGEWFPVSVLAHSGRGGQSLARALVAFLFLMLALVYYKLGNRISDLSRELDGPLVAWEFLAGHVCSMAVFLTLNLHPGLLRFPAALLWVAWIASGLLGIALAAFAFAPPRFWLTLVRAAGPFWIVAGVGSVVAWRMVGPFGEVWYNSGWPELTDSTFALATLLLRPFFSDLISDRAKILLGTPKFAVTIGGACSGLEGGGLMLVFGIGWLWFLRREFRFPQALLLIPAGLAVMWLSNGVRIAALILIGNAGAPGIAMGGFHSQAGWISFNVVALGVVVASGRVAWWSRRPPHVPVSGPVVRNPAAAYLAPFLLVLASAMVSRAASSEFEWLYPLRFFAAAAILWHFRSRYAGLSWRCNWRAPAAGALVFLLWISLDALHPPPADNGMSAAILDVSPLLARITWLSFRTLAAVVTVPIVEELAFRGFLIRRLMANDFESLDPRQFTWFAVLVSSLVFGLLHGDRWIAGSIAGLIYAGVMLRRGSIGDAVAAHATTNALIAFAVLVGGKWNLW